MVVVEEARSRMANGSTRAGWVLTVVEIVGGVVLASGLLVRPLALWFGAEIAAGIAMVHGKEGWFVVGAGRNGSEYSALIIACLLVVARTDSVAHKVRAGTWANSR